MRTNSKQKKETPISRVPSTDTKQKNTVVQKSPMADKINNSPRQILQQQKQEALFGSALQREAAEKEQTETTDKNISGSFHAKISSDDADELIQEKAIQLKYKDKEGDNLQLKSVTQQAPNKTGMPDNLKSGVEQLSGLDMSDVRVHLNSDKPAAVQAHAYTQGTNIHVAPGQERHLPHEVWHVAQQKQGRVQPTTSINGMAVNDNAGLEKEADLMGGRALQMKESFNLHSLYYNNSRSILQMERDVNMPHISMLSPIDSTNNDVVQFYWGESNINTAIKYIKSATWDSVTSTLSTIVSTIGMFIGEGKVGSLSVLAKSTADIIKYIHIWYKNSNPVDDDQYRAKMSAKYKIITSIGEAMAAATALYIACQDSDSSDDTSTEAARLQKANQINASMVGLNLLFKFIMGTIEEKSKEWQFLGDHANVKV